MTFRSRFVFPALVAAGVLWGTTVPLSKVALTWLAPGWLAFARFALAGGLLAIVTRPRLRAAMSPGILVTGGAGYGGSVLLQNLGIERTSVMHAALLIGATPVLVAAIAAIAGLGVARPVAWAGFAVSLTGVGLIAGGRGAGSSLGGDGLVLAGQLASAGFTVAQARLLRGRDPVAVTAVQLLSAAVAVLPAALAGGPVPTHIGGTTALLATMALVLVGTVAPTTLFAFAQSRVTADVAGAFLNLEPLFGAAIGVVLFGNALGPVQLAGGAGVVTGIGLSTYQVARDERGRRPRPTAASSLPELTADTAQVATARPAPTADTAQVAKPAPTADTAQVARAQVGMPVQSARPAEVARPAQDARSARVGRPKQDRSPRRSALPALRLAGRLRSDRASLSLAAPKSAASATCSAADRLVPRGHPGMPARRGVATRVVPGRVGRPLRPARPGAH